MSYHALVVDDDPDILEDVKDRLEGMGHTCDSVTCQTDARECLKSKAFSYVLLDLEIPVRYGRPARIPNGQNLLAEIRAMRGLEGLPVIVMTAHGLDGPDLAVEVMRDGHATDFVKKPFPSKGETLEKRIHDALARAGRTRLGGAKYSKVITKEAEPLPFEAGVLTFHETHVELEGVKICGDAESGRIRKILDELRLKDARDRLVAHSGQALAKKIGCTDRGQNGVAEAVRDFRKHLTEIMRDAANLAIGSQDVLQTTKRGYQLTDKITVHEADDVPNDPQSDRGHDPDDPVNDPLNERQVWILNELWAGKQIRIGDVVKQFPRSKTTAKRDLSELRRRGLVEFEGSARTGFWRPKR